MYSVTSSYDSRDYIARDSYDFNSYYTRLSRYEILDGYYHNTPYHKMMPYSQGLKVYEGLYKHIRGVHNVVKRAVDGNVSKVYGGMLDTKTGEQGAIPIDTENKRLREAIAKRLWIDSQWGQKKSLYVRYGAKFGDVFIKVVDDIHKRRVRLEVVDPMKVKELEKDPDGTVTYIEFEYYIRHNGELIKYCEKITPKKFYAYGQKPYYDHNKSLKYERIAIHTNGRGETVEEWDNEYGFVPVVHVLHADEGQVFGASCVHGLLPKINELNDLASILNDGMRRQVEMPLVSINAKIEALDFGSDQSTNTYNTSDKPRKDTANVVNLVGARDGMTPDLKTIAPTLNVADGLLNIKEIKSEIEQDKPELALSRLRDSANLTAPGVRSAYDDAISQYQESRGNYDTGLVKGQKMGVYIGAMRGYDGYDGLSATDLDDESLNHQIKERPVISDTLSLSEQMDFALRAQQQNMPKAFYQKAGWTEAEADELVASAQASRDSYMMTSPFETATTTPQVDDPDATPDDAFNQRENSAMNAGDVLNADSLLAEVG